MGLIAKIKSLLKGKYDRIKREEVVDAIVKLQSEEAQVEERVRDARAQIEALMAQGRGEGHADAPLPRQEDQLPQRGAEAEHAAGDLPAVQRAASEQAEIRDRRQAVLFKQHGRAAQFAACRPARLGAVSE